MAVMTGSTSANPQRGEHPAVLPSPPRLSGRGSQLGLAATWSLIGSLVFAAGQWSLVIVIAKLGNPRMLGDFAFGLAVTAPLFMFASLQLRALMASDPGERFSFPTYSRLRWLTSVAAVASISVVLVILRLPTELVSVVLLIGLTKFIESISDLHYGRLHQHDRLDVVARSMILRGVTATLALTAGLWLTGRLSWALAAVSAVWLGILVLHDRSSSQRIRSRRPASDSIDLRTLAYLGLPLGVAMLLVSLNTQVLRLLVERFLDIELLGIFTAISVVPLAGSLAVNSLGQALMPRLSQSVLKGDRSGFRRLIVGALAVCAAFGVVGVACAALAGEQLLARLYSSRYAEYPSVLTWLMVGAGFGYLASILGCVATSTRRVRYQPLALLVTVATTSVAAWCLLPRFGLLGGAYSTVVGSIMNCFTFVLVCAGPKR